MNTSHAGEPASPKSLRPWLGVVAVALWFLRFALGKAVPEAFFVSIIGGLAGGAAVIAWWIFFSKAPRAERWGGALVTIAALLAGWRLSDPSIATGYMGMMYPVYAIPVLGIAIAGWEVFSGRLAAWPRRASLIATILLACGGWTLLRTEGVYGGEAGSEFDWRWSATREQRLLARPAVQLPAVAVAVAEAPEVKVRAETPGEAAPVAVAAEIGGWPGFRGPARDGVIPGTRIKTDWAATPPVKLWRHEVGPGWGSFAVRGNLIYTQEQRGEDEVVACYHATTGKPVWAHRDAARFWESMAGAGPRATPAVDGGRVYTLGATGILNALDAATGAMLWSRNAASEHAKQVPGWGFAGSPLVVDGMVVAALSGLLAAYDATTGEPRWKGPAIGGGYSSPHLATIGGVAQILLLTSQGAAGVAQADGALLWKHSWPSDARIMQPVLTGDGGVLISNGDGMGGSGMRRLAVALGAGGWKAEEQWTSAGLKSNFSDFVVHEGHVYGFDGSIMACIDAKDGKRKWKGGRYGHGQLV